MHSEGHVGFSLSVLSLFMVTFGWIDIGSITMCFFIAVFSLLPDIDLRLRPLVTHRGVTHTLLAGIIFGIILAVITSYAGYGWSIGLAAGFGGTVLHLVGDTFNYTKIKPLWPFSHREVALRLFKSSNWVANKGFATLGGLALLLIFLKYVGYL